MTLTAGPKTPLVGGTPMVAEHARRVRAARRTRAERAAGGKQQRQALPLADLAETHRGTRADPIDLLESQAATRVSRLVPIRYGRMLATPFTFYRGAALVMAADLGSTPHSGLEVQLCGDAHLSNFGVYLTPERLQAFDINDFDETHPGPFEWDVKRLAASVAVASLTGGFSARKARQAAAAAASGYRQEMRRLAPLRNLAVWYSHQDVQEMIKQVRRRLGADVEMQMATNLRKALYRDSVDAVRKLCVTVDGQVQFKNEPPLIMPGEEILTAWGEDVDAWYGFLDKLVHSYRRTLQSDRRRLLDEFGMVQIGFKVVGVGSVGTRAWLLLLDGADPDDPLILQAKEAQRSVLADYVKPARRFRNQGERVVDGQRLTQMTSDIFLGWQHVTGIDGRERDFYIRQLRDGKGSIVVENLSPSAMSFYAGVCGQTLARAHARSGDRIAIAAYLGKSSTFDDAIAEYSMACAELNAQDHRALEAAVQSGRVQARPGI